MNIFLKSITLLIFFFSFHLSAQKTIWLDTNLKTTNQSNTTYYKVISENEKEINYFYKSGKIYRKIEYSKRKPIGIFSEFYETGELKTSGKYENGMEEGIWKTYYKTGKIKERGKYNKGEKVGIWKTFYKNF